MVEDYSWADELGEQLDAAHAEVERLQGERDTALETIERLKEELARAQDATTAQEELIAQIMKDCL